MLSAQLSKWATISLSAYKAGSPASRYNRFLMESGLEIYDVSIWERPIRLAQVRTEQPVSGLAVLDNLVYLANGSDGLQVVDVAVLEQPLLIANVPVPGHIATDVALDRANHVLALAAANVMGSGYIRFLDLASDELSPAPNYNDIYFDHDPSDVNALYGQPVDLAWHNGELYVLLKRGTALYLAIFTSFGDAPDYSIHAIEARYRQ